MASIPFAPVPPPTQPRYSSQHQTWKSASSVLLLCDGLAVNAFAFSVAAAVGPQPLGPRPLAARCPARCGNSAGEGGRGEWREARSAREAGLVLRAKKGGAVSAMCFPARTHQREGERHGHQDREKVDGQRSPVDRLRDRVERRHILESPPTRAQQPASKHWALGRFDSNKNEILRANFREAAGNQTRATGDMPRMSAQALADIGLLDTLWGPDDQAPSTTTPAGWR